MLHPLLIKQLARCGVHELDRLPDPATWAKLLERIAKTYREADDERYLMERSLTTSSAEMLELNDSLQRSQIELSIDRDRLQALTVALVLAKERAESALRETEVLQQTLNEHASCSVADKAGLIIDVNDKFCSLSGYSRGELLGMDHKLLNSAHHPRSFWAEIWRAITSGNAWQGDICNRAKDGSIYWVNSIIAPFKGRDGEIEKYVSIHNDITKRKHAEQALQRMDQLQEEMGRVARIGGWELEPASGRLTWTNQVYEIFDLPRSFTPDLELCLGLFAGETRTLLADSVARAIELGQGFDLILPFSAVSGERLWLRILGKVERRGNGSVGLYGAVQDVTASYLKNAELVAALRSTEASTRAKSEFLANMSHEIRTPMTAILGYADLLCDEGDSASIPPARREMIETIRGAGVHLMSIINDILDISKIEADKMMIERVETPLVQLLIEVANLMRARAEENSVRLELRLDSPLPERVLTDPTRVRQILMNLVGNAVKFTEIGSVTIVARAEARDGESRLIIDVVDTGIGMAPAQADQLFAPFTQADTTMTRKFGGTGLGLTICRRLARLMGGEITLARTEAGKGSCFRTDLPLEAVEGCRLVQRLDALGNAAGAAEDAATIALRGKILLAEDGVINQRLIALHLRRAGAEVDIVEHGKFALDVLAQADATGSPYDLLLTDMQMPEMDGYTLARTLRSGGSSLAIVALTAHAMAEDRDRCLAAGCDDYVAKPINRTELLTKCSEWMGVKSRGSHQSSEVG